MAEKINIWLLKLSTICAVCVTFTKCANPYPHDVICNNGTSHACICYQADQSMREYYTDCDVFMKPNVNISVVVLQFSGLNLNGHTYNGDPYETQFKSTVADIISTFCQRHAQECPGTMLPVEPDRIILMSIDCQGANNEQTQVTFVVTQNKNSFQIAPWFLLDAGLIVRILTVKQRKLSQGVGNMRVLEIYSKWEFKAPVPYPTETGIQPTDRGGPSPSPKPFKLDNNKILVYILCGIGAALCVCYVIAIYKVCVDYHQRKRAEKQQQAEEKDQLNNGQPTAYGAIGEENSNNNKNDAAVTMIITSESFTKQKVTKRSQSQSSLTSDAKRANNQSSSKRSSNSSVNSKASNQQTRVTHQATVNRSQDSDPQIAADKKQRHESDTSPLPFEDTGYYIPEPQPMPPTPPDQLSIEAQPQIEVNIIDNPMAEIPDEQQDYKQTDQYAAPIDANGYSYGYYNEHGQGEEQQSSADWQGADGSDAVDSVTQDYYDNYTYTAEDGTVYYWDGQQWQYMYPEQVAEQQADMTQYDAKSVSSTSTAPVYSDTPPCTQINEQLNDQTTPTAEPPNMPLPPLPPLPTRERPKTQSSIDSSKSLSSTGPPRFTPPVPPPDPMQRHVLGKSVSLRSVKRLQQQASITSTDGAPAITPMEPLLESARSATLTDVREHDDKTQDSDLSSESDTDNEEESPTMVEQPATRIVPYHQMPVSLTPMQSMEQPDTCNTINQVASAPPNAADRLSKGTADNATVKQVQQRAAPPPPPPPVRAQNTRPPPPPPPPCPRDVPDTSMPEVPVQNCFDSSKENNVSEPASFDPFGMINDSSVWKIQPEPSTNHVNGKTDIIPIRPPEKNPLPSQFALSNEHLVSITDQPYEDVQEFKMLSYDPSERAACDSENSSDAASSSEEEMDTMSSTVRGRTQASRPRIVDNRSVKDPYDVDNIAEVCGSHEQHLALASADYQRLAESNLSMNVTAADNNAQQTSKTAVSDEEESFR